MLHYGPIATTPRGLCLVVSDAGKGDHHPTNALAGSLREMAIASVITWTGSDDAVVVRQRRILSLLRFAEDQLPDLNVLIVVDTANLPSLLALLRGRPAMAARVNSVLLVQPESAHGLSEEIGRRFIG